MELSIHSLPLSFELVMSLGSQVKSILSFRSWALMLTSSSIIIFGAHKRDGTKEEMEKIGTTHEGTVIRKGNIVLEWLSKIECANGTKWRGRNLTWKKGGYKTFSSNSLWVLKGKWELKEVKWMARELSKIKRPKWSLHFRRTVGIWKTK